ncbi:hypothetical protein AVEN_9222-1 [Araneus ventricosus]|uniref:Uncharacterized protein n=1 Tax=Araneus ventricosus TaxID=182803 RepID=A0A4Y2RDP5_ARAVE|nr:hypothetical protein AVEN_9222-1 [Araneus ventricosus]
MNQPSVTNPEKHRQNQPRNTTDQATPTRSRTDPRNQCIRENQTQPLNPKTNALTRRIQNRITLGIASNTIKRTESAETPAAESMISQAT